MIIAVFTIILTILTIITITLTIRLTQPWQKTPLFISYHQKGFSPNVRIEEAKRNQFEPNPRSLNHSAHNGNLALRTPHHLMMLPNLKRRIQEDGFHNKEVFISLNMEKHLENENDCL